MTADHENDGDENDDDEAMMITFICATMRLVDDVDDR